MGVLVAALCAALLALTKDVALGFSVHSVFAPPGRSRAIHTRSSLLDTEWNSERTSSRRNLLLASSAALAAAAVAKYIPETSANAPILATVHEAIQWIEEFCDRRFLHAVVASDYRFLYRGVPEDMKIPSIRMEEPDLLSVDTYGTPAALQFFKDLEVTMSQEAVRPSNGHLTASIEDASAWGKTVASIWPMGPAHYAWFQDGGLFYPRRGSSADRNSIIVDGRDCGKDSLEDALLGDSWEIMVATKSFLAVPVSMEKDLRDELQKSFLV